MRTLRLALFADGAQTNKTKKEYQKRRYVKFTSVQTVSRDNNILKTDGQ